MGQLVMDSWKRISAAPCATVDDSKILPGPDACNGSSVLASMLSESRQPGRREQAPGTSCMPPATSSTQKCRILQSSNLYVNTCQRVITITA